MRAFAKNWLTGALRVLYFAGAALVLIWAVSTSAARTEPVEPLKGEVAVDTSGGYARLVFRMAEQIDATVRLSGNILIVTFPRPVAISTDLLAANARDYISVVRRDPDGTGLRIALARKIQVNKQLAGERIYLDLLPQTWTGAKPGLPQDVVEDLARRAREAESKLRAQKGPERKVPNVRVRVGAQPTFTRYIFEIPDGVAVSTEKSVEKLTLKFNRPINFDLADTRDDRPPTLDAIDSDLDHDYAAVNFRFNARSDVRAFREDQVYIVDVSTRGMSGGAPAAEGGDAAAVPDKLPGLQAPDTIPANGSEAKKAAEAIMAPSAAKVEAKVETKVDAKVEAKADIKADAKAADTVSPPAVKLAAEEPKAAPAKVMTPPIAETKKETDAEPAADAAEPKALPGEPVMEKPAAERAPNAPMKVDLRRDGDTIWMVFPFALQTPAAMFMRADTLWLVFDTAEKFDLSALDNDRSKTIRSASVTRPDDNTAVLRIRLERPRLMSLTTFGVGWTVSLADKVTDPSRGLTVARNIIGPHRSSITIPIDDPRKLHRLTDPVQGDDLLVVTSLGPARGFARTQDFVELRALSSTHGVVVQPLADDLVAELGADKIVLSRPNGLTLSKPTGQAAAMSRGTMLDSQLWGFDRQAEFNARQSELIAKAAAAPKEKRLNARMDVARFYLARDMYPEAKAVLDVALADDKADDGDITGVVLRAVANVMLDRSDEALKDLANPLVGKQYDAPIWRALAYADQGHWPEARDSFRDVQMMIAALPVELQRVALRRSVRSSIEVKDFAGASKQLSEFETIGVPSAMEPSIAVLSGRIAEGVGNPVDALKFYREAADSPDRRSAAQGRLRELVMRYGKGEINRIDMIAELETLTSVWRGDETEIEGQQWLARLYTEEGRYRDAFRVMRTALLAHPNSQTTRKIHDEAAQSFEALFLAGKGDALPAIEALGLFYDYRELTPIGRRGDEMIRRLAERLAAVDLLDQAAELLQHQVDHRLQGAARAQVATRLAVIYLTNRKADRALATLRSTRTGDLSNELRTQRLLIEARALSDVGRSPLALEVIEKMESREAIRLRSDILWKMKRWAEAGEQIERLYGDRWKEFQPLSATERPDILRAAIGYALGEDSIGLARLREKYAAKMAEGPDRRAFEVVTAPAGTANAEFGKVANVLASYDSLAGFLEEMRARYPETGALSRPLSSEIEGDPSPAATNSILPERSRGASLQQADLIATGSIAPRRTQVALPRPRPRQ